MYADYSFYTDTFLGSAIKEPDFARLALRASDYIDYYTRGKAAKADFAKRALGMACCALAEQYQAIETAQALAQKSLAYSATASGAELASESVGSWSQSYRTGGDSATGALQSAQAARQMLADIVKEYLAGTGLLYRGGCKCCSPTL